MNKCSSCGFRIGKNDSFCSKCGKKIKKVKKSEEEKNESTTKFNEEELINKIGENFEKILETEDHSKEYTKKDINSNKTIAALSYIGPLAVVSYIKKDNSKYINFHAMQGINLLIIWIIYSVTYGLLSLIKVTKSCDHFLWYVGNCVEVTPWWITMPLNIIGLILFAISLIGVINAFSGKAKKLPLISNIKFIK